MKLIHNTGADRVIDPKRPHLKPGNQPLAGASGKRKTTGAAGGTESGAQARAGRTGDGKGETVNLSQQPRVYSGRVCSTLFCKQALPILRRNTPAKPMTASADTLKSCGFFIACKKREAA